MTKLTIPFTMKNTTIYAVSAVASAIALLLGGMSIAHAAPVTLSDAVVAGSLKNLSARTILNPATEDVGKTIQIFVIAFVPNAAASTGAANTAAQSGTLFTKTTQGWQVVPAGGWSQPLPWAQVKAEATHALDLTQFDDVRGLTGVSFYVGYGVQSSTTATATTPATFTSAWDDMLVNQRFRLVYTLPASETIAQWGLQATNEAGLKTYITNAFKQKTASFTYSSGGSVAFNVSPLPVSPSTASADSSSTSNTVSGTTLQEAGVDEADLVKTDGTFIWSVLAPSISDSTVLQRHALQASTPTLTPVDTIKLPFSQGSRLTGLFLDSTGKQLAVLGESGQGWYGSFFGAWFSPYSWMQGNTEITLVDTSSATQMKVKRHLKFNASQIGARRIGSTLYMVLRNYPNIKGYDQYLGYYSPAEPAAIAANNALLNNMRVSDVLPQLSVDGGNNQAVVDAASCYTQPSNANPTADIITIVAIDLSATTERHVAKCFTGGTEAFYMSDKSIYLATTRYSYSYVNNFPSYAGRTSTDIHKFALNGMDIAYRGSGNVPGHLGFDQNRKSFRMGEEQDMLRVITQSTSSWGGWWSITNINASNNDSPGYLSILQEANGKLDLVAELPNARRPAPLGKTGEQLYATRFLGKRGYLVTYRLTDPLYVLDLSNPTDPYIAGELKVDGYSDYLFPLSENVLLGVGKDAVVTTDSSNGDGRFAWYQGVKLSLIDVSNPAQPREAARSIIGKRGTDATVLRDHHGIAIAGVGTNNVRISLPVSVNESTPYYYTTTDNPSNYYSFTRNELAKFDIDMGQKTLVQRPSLSSFMPTLRRDISSDRSIIWNNQLHYYQSGDWKSGAW